MINALKSIFAVIIAFSKGLEGFGNAFALSASWAEEGMQQFADTARAEREVSAIQNQARIQVAKARALADAKAKAVSAVKEAEAA